jgi:hypothetical protein
MKKSRVITITLVLTLTFAMSVIFADARASDPQVDLRFRPIGIVHTFGGVTVNGRVAHALEELWGGELIEAPTMTSALVVLHAIGQVTLSGGTRARLSVSSPVDSESHRSILVASLLSGQLKVALQTGALAYFEAAGSGYTASEGASFSCAIRGGNAAVETLKGSVHEEKAIREQTPLPVKVSIDRRFSAKSNGTVNVRVQVTRARSRSGGATRTGAGTAFYLVDPATVQGDEPIPNTSVRFDLNPPALGVVNPIRVTTDAQGFATTTVTAGSQTGKGTIRATAEESGAYAEGEFTVRSPFTFWMMENRTLLIIGAAATAVAVPVIVNAVDGNRRITAVGDPVIKP